MKRALVNSDRSIKKAGVRAIQRMAWTGQPDATEFLLDYCTHHEIQDSIALVDTLAKTGDPRAVPVLLEMLQQSRDKDYTWPRHILLAVGKTGDQRAVKPVLRWLLEHRDGSEQYAAMALPELAGAEALRPQLLRELVGAPNSNTRYALRKAIESIGGNTLAAELVRLLLDTDAGDQHQAGLQKDILLLMEAFPDLAAKPMLQTLLKTDNCFSHLYAARVLGKLGDYTGVPVLLEDLFTKQPAHFHFHAHDVGQALKDIGDPETRERLEALYRRVEGEDRGRVFKVIGQQADLAFLPFLDKIVDDSTDPTLLCGAAEAIGMLIYSMPKDKPRQALEITDTNLAAARLLLGLAFHGERLRDFDHGFPDHALLAKKQGAVLKAGEYAYLLYKTEDGTLREMSMKNPDDAQLIERARPRSEDSFGYGSVDWTVYKNYMCLDLNVDAGGSSHLFQMKDGQWAPVCSLGSVME
ncbi:MAG: HEAT repeat domain-containing protein [Planctomycetes bacterium]|nr:HEAT repeat domain-containing protein [Planctomycetota bacterium]